MEELKRLIRNIPDFPKKGILFRDITTLIGRSEGFKKAVDELSKEYEEKGIDFVVGIEARGFILGGAVAYKLGVGFVPVRKEGKLPYRIISATYELEYGKDTLTLHEDSIRKGSRVLIVDDLLATGGTASCVTKLVERLGGEIIGIIFLIELTDLKGRDKLKGYPVHSIIKY